MKLNLRARGVRMSDKLRDHVERRVHFALGRFGDRVRKVNVMLEDVNGPRGGYDTVCRIQAHLAPRGTLIVEETRLHAFSAVALAADRIGRSMKRHLGRLATRRKGR